MKHSLAFAILVLAPLFTACVTSADIGRLQSNLDLYESGAVTKAEYEENNKAIKKDIEDRERDLEESALGLADLVVPGFGSLLAGGIALYRKTKKDAVIQVNHDRDQKYVAKNPETIPDEMVPSETT
jgi:hypothetical protein